LSIHDWTRVSAGIFHHFHFGWIGDLSRTLNGGLLPSEYYALAERFDGGLGPDDLKLQRSDRGTPAEGPNLASVVIRHASNHQVVARLEVVSPGNKNTRHALRAFVDKAVNVLRAGIHLVVLDLFPPDPRDPQGIHKAIWDEFIDNDYHLPPESSLAIASYIGGAFPEAFVEPISVGDSLPDLPLFLSPEFYVLLPLEKAYESAWEAVPSFWRDVLTSDPPA
jgi:Protein of unknown function (DUF4058)